jgi:multidrug efflux pump subunit AcrB
LKITVVLAINLIIFSSFLGTANLTAQKNPVGTINEIEIKVNFNGKKAKDRIEKELSREKGILKVTVNPEHKVVIVKFNHSTDTKKINSAL